MDTVQHIEEAVSKKKALAFKDLYDSNFGTLLFFAKRYVASQEEAEDVVQEIIIKYVINLDSAGTGALASNVAKLKDGEIKYTADEKAVTIYSNTLTNLRGRQTSDDRSKVWLNAASPITFLSHFAGAQRWVTVTGKVYFEVASKANMPFVVTANNTNVTVLGTRFNVNAYSDEAAIKTTFIDGSVRVSAGGAAAVLKPGKHFYIQ